MFVGVVDLPRIGGAERGGRRRTAIGPAALVDCR